MSGCPAKMLSSKKGSKFTKLLSRWHLIDVSASKFFGYWTVRLGIFLHYWHPITPNIGVFFLYVEISQTLTRQSHPKLNRLQKIRKLYKRTKLTSYRVLCERCSFTGPYTFSILCLTFVIGKIGKLYSPNFQHPAFMESDVYVLLKTRRSHQKWIL